MNECLKVLGTFTVLVIISIVLLNLINYKDSIIPKDNKESFENINIHNTNNWKTFSDDMKKEENKEKQEEAKRKQEDTKTKQQKAGETKHKKADSDKSKIDTAAERKHIVDVLSGHKYRKYVPDDIRKFLREFDNSESRLYKALKDNDLKCPGSTIHVGSKKHGKNIKCFGFQELYSASEDAKKEWKSDRLRKSIRKNRRKYDHDYKDTVRDATRKYKHDRKKLERKLKKLARRRKRFQENIYGYEDSDEDKDLDTETEEETDDESEKQKVTKKDTKKEQATRKVEKTETAVSKKFMDNEFSKVFNRIDNLEKQLEEETKRDAIQQQEQEKHQKLLGEKIDEVTRERENVEGEIDTSVILDNEDRMKKFDDACKYIQKKQWDFGFGNNGYSYMKDIYWDKGRNRSATNCPSNCEPSGIYAQGAPVGALEQTTVGSILPAFKYTEEGYKCPEYKKPESIFKNVDMLEADKGVLNPNAWRGSTGDKGTATGYGYGGPGERADVLIKPSEKELTKIETSTDRDFDRLPNYDFNVPGAHRSTKPSVGGSDCGIFCNTAKRCKLGGAVCKGCPNCAVMIKKEEEAKKAEAKKAEAKKAEAKKKATKKTDENKEGFEDFIDTGIIEGFKSQTEMNEAIKKLTDLDYINKKNKDNISALLMKNIDNKEEVKLICKSGYCGTGGPYTVKWDGQKWSWLSKPSSDMCNIDVSKMGRNVELKYKDKDKKIKTVKVNACEVLVWTGSSWETMDKSKLNQYINKPIYFKTSDDTIISYQTDIQNTLANLTSFNLGFLESDVSLIQQVYTSDDKVNVVTKPTQNNIPSKDVKKYYNDVRNLISRNIDNLKNTNNIKNSPFRDINKLAISGDKKTLYDNSIIYFNKLTNMISIITYLLNINKPWKLYVNTHLVDKSTKKTERTLLNEYLSELNSIKTILDKKSGSSDSKLFKDENRKITRLGKQVEQTISYLYVKSNDYITHGSGANIKYYKVIDTPYTKPSLLWKGVRNSKVWQVYVEDYLNNNQNTNKQNIILDNTSIPAIQGYKVQKDIKTISISNDTVCRYIPYSNNKYNHRWNDTEKKINRTNVNLTKPIFKNCKDMNTNLASEVKGFDDKNDENYFNDTLKKLLNETFGTAQSIVISSINALNDKWISFFNMYYPSSGSGKINDEHWKGEAQGKIGNLSVSDFKDKLIRELIYRRLDTKNTSIPLTTLQNWLDATIYDKIKTKLLTTGNSLLYTKPTNIKNIVINFNTESKYISNLKTKSSLTTKNSLIELNGIFVTINDMKTHYDKNKYLEMIIAKKLMEQLNSLNLSKKSFWPKVNNKSLTLTIINENIKKLQGEYILGSEFDVKNIRTLQKASSYDINTIVLRNIVKIFNNITINTFKNYYTRFTQHYNASNDNVKKLFLSNKKNIDNVNSLIKNLNIYKKENVSYNNLMKINDLKKFDKLFNQYKNNLKNIIPLYNKINKLSPSFKSKINNNKAIYSKDNKQVFINNDKLNELLDIVGQFKFQLYQDNDIVYLSGSGKYMRFKSDNRGGKKEAIFTLKKDSDPTFFNIKNGNNTLYNYHRVFKKDDLYYYWAYLCNGCDKSVETDSEKIRLIYQSGSKYYKIKHKDEKYKLSWRDVEDDKINYIIWCHDKYDDIDNGCRNVNWEIRAV